MKGCGVFCRGHKIGGPWLNLETREHVHVLELKAAKLAIVTFMKIFPGVK